MFFLQEYMEPKIKTEDCVEILFLHFFHHIHNPEWITSISSHRFLIPWKCKRRNTKKEFKVLLELVMEKVQRLPVFAYQSWPLLKKEN